MAKKHPKMSGVLKRLLFEKGMKASDLARAIDMPVPTIHRIVTGKSTRPYQKSIDAISSFFKISQAQLFGDEPLQKQSESSSNPLNLFTTAENLKDIKTVPIVPWEQVRNYKSTTDHFKKLPCLSDIGNECFAVYMPDSSMSPIFEKGSILIMDPDKLCTDRCFVLVELDGSKILIFRQLLIDGDHHYLKPLNPDLTRFRIKQMSNEDKIIACLVESRQVYYENLDHGVNK